MFFLFCGFSVQAAPPREKLTLGVVETCRPAHTQIVEEFYAEIFSRIGVNVVLVEMPLKRIQYEIEQGILDGDFLRPKGFEGGTVRVDSPIFPVVYTAYGKDGSGELANCARNIQSGEGCGLMIGYVRGAFVPHSEMLSRDKFPRTYPLNSMETGLRMLNEKRIDLFVGAARVVDCILEGPSFDKSTIRKLSPVASVDGYICLHKEHEGVARRLTETLNAMKADGSFEKVLKEVVSRHQTQ